jgi:hypothetical protein
MNLDANLWSGLVNVCVTRVLVVPITSSSKHSLTSRLRLLSFSRDFVDFIENKTHIYFQYDQAYGLVRRFSSRSGTLIWNRCSSPSIASVVQASKSPLRSIARSHICSTSTSSTGTGANSRRSLCISKLRSLLLSVYHVPGCRQRSAFITRFHLS